MNLTTSKQQQQNLTNTDTGEIFSLGLDPNTNRSFFLRVFSFSFLNRAGLCLVREVWKQQPVQPVPLSSF